MTAVVQPVQGGLGWVIGWILFNIANAADCVDGAAFSGGEWRINGAEQKCAGHKDDEQIDQLMDSN